MLDKVAMVFGQMNEPPGARARVALSGSPWPNTSAIKKTRRASLHRQHLPLHAGRFGSVSAPRTHSISRGIPANARIRNGNVAGTHHFDRQRFDHFCAGCVRASRRPYRPSSSNDFRSPRLYSGFEPGAHRSVFTRLLILWTLHRLSSTPHIVGEEHYDVAREVQQHSSALQRPAGHHCHPWYGRALRRGQAARDPRS